MKDGVIVQVGTPEDILHNPTDDYVKSFVKGISQLRYVTAQQAMVPLERYGVIEKMPAPEAMSVVASMISVTGLGQMVLRGIGRLDMSVASTGGLGIVLIAITIDRISQGFGLSRRDRGHRNWYQVGPIGMIIKLIKKSDLKSG